MSHYDLLSFTIDLRLDASGSNWKKFDASSQPPTTKPFGLEWSVETVKRCKTTPNQMEWVPVNFFVKPEKPFPEFFEENEFDMFTLRLGCRTLSKSLTIQDGYIVGTILVDISEPDETWFSIDVQLYMGKIQAINGKYTFLRFFSAEDYYGQLDVANINFRHCSWILKAVSQQSNDETEKKLNNINLVLTSGNTSDKQMWWHNWKFSVELLSYAPRNNGSFYLKDRNNYSGDEYIGLRSFSILAGQYEKNKLFRVVMHMKKRYQLKSRRPLIPISRKRSREDGIDIEIINTDLPSIKKTCISNE